MEDVDLGEERAARNEAMFRYVNEHVEELARGQDESAAEFLCECSNPECVERIRVPLAVYATTRSNPRAFLLVPGHQDSEIESVQIVADDYLVVEKTGQAAAVAERTDPR